MRLLPVLLLGVAFAAVSAEPRAAVKVGGSDSPDGKYALVAMMEQELTCRVEVQTKETGKVVGHFSIPDYDADDQRYAIRALWKPDATAFALSIDHGRNITHCRIYAGGPASWTELSMPKKPIEKIEAAASSPNGKAQGYLEAKAWLPGNKVKLSYLGNFGLEWGAVFRVVRTGKPHLEHVETLAPKPDPEPKLDAVPCTARIFAGSGEGTADGPVATAQFRGPSGMAIDTAGNILVADRENQTLRRINPQGVVETVAGSPGEAGAADGTGNEARFRYPQGLAVDAEGNVYVADTSNSRVRRVTPAGVVTTLAGDLKYPNGVAVDREGNVLVADSVNRVIRKIGRDGVMSILAGQLGSAGSNDGPAQEARFDFPRGLAVAADGAVYVADVRAIRKIDANGNVTTLAGVGEKWGKSDGKGAAAGFWGLTSIALDAAGNLYVADHELKNIRRVSPTGVVKTLRDRVHGALPLDDPMAIALDARGRIYVADANAHTIVVVELVEAKGGSKAK